MMVKFVVSFVVAGRDLSILEMDLLGRENEAGFFGFQDDKGGKK